MKILEYKKVLKETPVKVRQKLAVTLKHTKKSGTGLFATKKIKKGRTIAYYKLKIFNDSKYKSPTNRMYAITIYTKDDKERMDVIGDITKDTIPPPKYGIPFWGPFANEPSGKNIENAELDLDLKKNYKHKNKLNVFDFIVYRLKSIRDIKAGDEICWCYGEVYGRKYKANCD